MDRSNTPSRLQGRSLLLRMFAAAVASAQPSLCIPAHLPNVAEPGRGRLIVIDAGKASAAIAHAVERHWTEIKSMLTGLVVTRYGYAARCEHVEIVQASHPVPDAAGLAAAYRLHGLVHDPTPDDFVLCLISGGGSSLLPLPLPARRWSTRWRSNVRC